MKLKCINLSTGKKYKHLTLNDIYHGVLNLTGDKYYVVNNVGKECLYPISTFSSVILHRNKILNNLLNK